MVKRSTAARHLLLFLLAFFVLWTLRATVFYSIVPATIAIALTSLLFVGVHLPYWLSHGGASRAMMAHARGVFAFSVVACWLYARTGSVWPSTVAHVANNVLSSLLAASNA